MMTFLLKSSRDFFAHNLLLSLVCYNSMCVRDIKIWKNGTKSSNFALLKKSLPLTHRKHLILLISHLKCMSKKWVYVQSKKNMSIKEINNIFQTKYVNSQIYGTFLDLNRNQFSRIIRNMLQGWLLSLKRQQV